MRTIKDYLHLYLGCEMQTENGISFIESVADDLIGDETRDESGEGWYHINDIKPILRPLSDITESEFKEYETSGTIPFKPFGFMHMEAAKTKYLLDKHFDLFGLIEAGLAVDKTKI